MSRIYLVGCLILTGLISVPTDASACALSRRLPAEIRANDTANEGRAWVQARLVYVAEITGAAEDYSTFELTPRRVLKGGVMPPILNIPAAPSRGMCVFYTGLNVSDGATIGEEFVIYSDASVPVADGPMYVVSVRWLSDPATRRALAEAE